MAGHLGHKKAGGRKKGTPNKLTGEVIKIAEEMGCNPFEILCRFAMGDWEALGYSDKTMVTIQAGRETIEDRITPIMRLKAAVECCRYLYPTRKAIDIKTIEIKEERPLAHLTDEELAALTKKRLIGE